MLSADFSTNCAFKIPIKI